ncbi:Uncharacterized protein dnl_41980 [Desulfonema limicola]|uniref:Uncharacterized protein n=1 Tax=Desulfonema limicola TaxID=45656 RepID=A0A975BAP6_9BACT|nr:Uncharacterized protein dnl_41980 [Desulfonema limicola]
MPCFNISIFYARLQKLKAVSSIRLIFKHNYFKRLFGAASKNYIKRIIFNVWSYMTLS